MRCPNCGFTESKVVDSRPTEDAGIRRRRECLNCGKRFTTYEIIDTLQIVVIKKDGTRDVFNKEKILSGLYKSCYKRPVTNEQINKIANDIEHELQNSLDPQINSRDIGEMVMKKLKEIDEVSYVRFASVYREFKDVDTFMKELSQLKNDKNNKTEQSNQ